MGSNRQRGSSPRTSGISGPEQPADAECMVVASADATRARILAEASELIANLGFDGTTVDEICKASGTNKSQFYRHFASKEDLIRAVLNDRTQSLLADQRQQLNEVTSMAGLDQWRDRIVAASQQRGKTLGNVAFHLADHSEVSRNQLARYFAEWHGLVAVTLRRMQVNGQLHRHADPDELATGLIAALQGGYVRTQTSRDAYHMATAIDMALARIRFFTGQH